MKKYYRRMRPLLGTFVEVGLSVDEPRNELAAESAFDVIEKVHNLLSFHDTNSELSKLNSSFQEVVSLDPVSIVMLKIAKRMTLLTDYLFDCTVGGRLTNLGLLPSHNKLPSNDFGNAKDIKIVGNSVKLLSLMKISLDGIAKGYAVDLGIRELKKFNKLGGWINAGGDLRIYGDVSLPVVCREIDGKVLNLGHFSNIAMASSRFSTNQDMDYPGYIISKNNANGPDEVCTITAPSAWLADALTKVYFSTSPSQRQIVVKKFGGQIIEPNRVDV